MYARTVEGLKMHNQDLYIHSQHSNQNHLEEA